MSSIDFLKFLKRTLDSVGIDLVGMSLIILKKEYSSNNKKIKLTENYVNGKIQGTVWKESKSNHSLKVLIKESTSDKFNIESDIAKSLYKYYYKDDDEFPSLIHVQTVLSDKMELLNKSPYLDALSIIRTIEENNSNLSDKILGSTFGINSKRYMS